VGHRGSRVGNVGVFVACKYVTVKVKVGLMVGVMVKVWVGGVSVGNVVYWWRNGSGRSKVFVGDT